MKKLLNKVICFIFKHKALFVDGNLYLKPKCDRCGKNMLNVPIKRIGRTHAT